MKEDGIKAYKEIDTGQQAIIADFRHMSEYKRNFDQIGLENKLFPANYLTTFPVVGILVINK